MKILIVSATKEEVYPFLQLVNQERFTFDLAGNSVEILITGVGLTATAFSLGQRLAMQEYDLAINVGLAGSFLKKIALGSVVEVIEDQIADEGAEDDKTFLSTFELGLREENQLPFQNGVLYPKRLNHRELGLKKCRAISVNKVHGNEESIAKIIQRTDPEVESMEGAAFFYACGMVQLPSLQLRAISNYVEKRNRSAWQIESSLKNLAVELAAYLKKV